MVRSSTWCIRQLTAIPCLSEQGPGSKAIRLYVDKCACCGRKYTPYSASRPYLRGGESSELTVKGVCGVLVRGVCAWHLQRSMQPHFSYSYRYGVQEPLRGTTTALSRGCSRIQHGPVSDQLLRTPQVELSVDSAMLLRTR